MNNMPPRSPSTLLTALLLLGASGSVAACAKGSTEKATKEVAVSDAELQQSAAAARQALDALKPAFSAQSAKIAALHREFDPLPPGLPGFGETRSQFYTTSIAWGALSAKLPWLSSRIDAAVQARSRAELGEVSKEIAETQAQLRRVDEITAELLRRVQPFKKQAAEKLEEQQALGKNSCE